MAVSHASRASARSAKGAIDLTLTGELDIANCGPIPSAVEQRCRDGYRRIRIDLEAVTFIDAAAANAFVEAARRAEVLGCEVVLGAVHGLPLRVLRLLELEALLESASDD
jgi:anti-anti-sigma factor